MIFGVKGVRHWGGGRNGGCTDLNFARQSVGWVPTVTFREIQEGKGAEKMEVADTTHGA